jgi:hypothetical protein
MLAVPVDDYHLMWVLFDIVYIHKTQWWRHEMLQDIFPESQYIN